MDLIRIVSVVPLAFAITLLSGISGGIACAAVIITIIRTFS